MSSNDNSSDNDGGVFDQNEHRTKRKRHTTSKRLIRRHPKRKKLNFPKKRTWEDDNLSISSFSSLESFYGDQKRHSATSNQEQKRPNHSSVTASRKRRRRTILQHDYSSSSFDPKEEADESSSCEEEFFTADEIEKKKPVAVDLDPKKIGTNDYKFKFRDDGSGRKLMNTVPMQFAMNMLEEQAKITAKHLGQQYKEEGKFEESKHVRLRALEQHVPAILERVRHRLRTTNLPTSSYQKIKDTTCLNPNAHHNLKEDKLKFKEAQQTLFKLERERQKQERKFQNEKEKRDSLLRDLEQFEESNNMQKFIHPLLSEKQRQLKGKGNRLHEHASGYRRAPKGTMQLFCKDLMQVHSSNTPKQNS